MILHSAGDIETYPLYTFAPCIAVSFCSETGHGLTLHRGKFDAAARLGSVRAKRISDSSYLVLVCCIDETCHVSSQVAINSLHTVFLKAVETDATVFFQYRARHFPAELMAFIKGKTDQAVVMLSKVDNGASNGIPAPT